MRASVSVFIYIHFSTLFFRRWEESLEGTKYLGFTIRENPVEKEEIEIRGRIAAGTEHTLPLVKTEEKVSRPINEI